MHDRCPLAPVHRHIVYPLTAEAFAGAPHHLLRLLSRIDVWYSWLHLWEDAAICLSLLQCNLSWHCECLTDAELETVGLTEALDAGAVNDVLGHHARGARFHLGHMRAD